MSIHDDFNKVLREMDISQSRQTRDGVCYKCGEPVEPGEGAYDEHDELTHINCPSSRLSEGGRPKTIKQEIKDDFVHAVTRIPYPDARLDQVKDVFDKIHDINVKQYQKENPETTPEQADAQVTADELSAGFVLKEKTIVHNLRLQETIKNRHYSTIKDMSRLASKIREGVNDNNVDHKDLLRLTEMIGSMWKTARLTESAEQMADRLMEEGDLTLREAATEISQRFRMSEEDAMDLMFNRKGE